MQDLHKALGDIRNIRRQVARSTDFQGYGPATVAGTGIIGILAAVVQRFVLLYPANRLTEYLTVWLSAAFLAATLAGAQMYTRSRRIHSGMSNEMMLTAVEQFLPSVGASTIITAVLLYKVPASLWMLPGIWQFIFGLGIFSSCRFLPRPMLAAGLWYFLTGLICLALGDIRALSPWAMGIPFGIGQLLVAAILFNAAREDAK